MFHHQSTRLFKQVLDLLCLQEAEAQELRPLQ
jgi:hypothetical protein